MSSKQSPSSFSPACSSINAPFLYSPFTEIIALPTFFQEYRLAIQQDEFSPPVQICSHSLDSVGYGSQTQLFNALQERDNVVYWKPKGKINNDLQCAAIKEMACRTVRAMYKQHISHLVIVFRQGGFCLNERVYSVESSLQSTS